MRTLLLVRHAPTSATRASAFPADEPLDERGRRAAAGLAAALPRRCEVRHEPGAALPPDRRGGRPRRARRRGRSPSATSAPGSGRSLADVNDDEPDGRARLDARSGRGPARRREPGGVLRPHRALAGRAGRRRTGGWSRSRTARWSRRRSCTRWARRCSRSGASTPRRWRHGTARARRPLDGRAPELPACSIRQRRAASARCRSAANGRAPRRRARRGGARRWLRSSASASTDVRARRKGRSAVIAL